MNKEDMINILNQHGLDALYDVMNNTIEKQYEDGYSMGYHEGYDDAKCIDDVDDDSKYTNVTELIKLMINRGITKEHLLHIIEYEYGRTYNYGYDDGYDRGWDSCYQYYNIDKLKTENNTAI